jgi:uncharacterized protein (UPF0332 family)
MSVSGADFIAIAERILVSEDTEIGWRVAAGRAYYGAFHCCAEIVDQHPAIVIDPSFATHERLYRAVANLSNSAVGSADLKSLAYLTKNLRDLRTVADYGIKSPFIRSHAEQAIAAAKNIQNLRARFRNRHGI